MKFKLEHVALNVSDPVAVAAWYEKHMGLTIERRIAAAHETHFLADSSGDVMLEIYNNPPDSVPDYKAMNPLLVHLGFVSDNAEKDKQWLLDAGATFVEEVNLPDGLLLIMMRDPWGLAIQLCQRAKPMLSMQL